MKKSTWLVIGLAVLVAVMFFSTCNGCKNNYSGKILVERVTTVEEEKPGDWEDSIIEDSSGVVIVPTAEQLQKERDHYFGRYQFYKKQAYDLLKNIQQRDARIVAALECDERSRLQQSQIVDMRAQLTRDSTLIEELFREFDNKGEKRQYTGTVTGEHYTTQWRSTIFGVMPPDGMEIKTDVTHVTTTIEKPYEVWRRNQFDIFAGADTDFQYLLGFGYERRVLKWAGFYGQAEFYPNQSRGVGKGGIRLHF